MEQAAIEGVLETLTKLFPAEAIKQRQGPGGKMLDYLETATVIERLNEAFGTQWSFRVMDHWIMKDTEGKIEEVIVWGEIAADLVVKQQFGNAVAKKGWDTGDMFKGAASDALKKCATEFGVGLQLYHDTPAPAHNGSSRGESAQEEEITEKQADYILQLAKSSVFTEEEKGRIIDFVDTRPPKSEASAKIEDLQKLIERRKARKGETK